MAQAANLLQAVDQGLQEGTPAGRNPVHGRRRLGSGDVLVRNDVVWEQPEVRDPQWCRHVVERRPRTGSRSGNYGKPGENSVSPTVAPANAFEAQLPPVQHYAVTGRAQDPMHARDARTATVILAGDGFGVPPSHAAGLFPDGVAFRYAGDLDEKAFAWHPAVGRADRPHGQQPTPYHRFRAPDGWSWTSPAAGPGPGLARAHSSVLPSRRHLRTAGVRVDASMTGSVFGTLPQAAPANAVDADPSTTWWFGDFSTAVGQSLTVTSTAEAAYGVLSIRTASQGPIHITRLRVSDGARTVDVPVDTHGVARADLGGTVSKTLRVIVSGISGDGFNLVGISDIAGLPLAVEPVAVLPRTVDDLVARLGTADRDAISATPVDLVFSRVRGTAATPDDDEEKQLARDFSLPVGRSYAASGSASPARGLAESELDRLAGADRRIVAQSSSRAFDLPTVRASMAVDGSLSTGWAPARADGCLDPLHRR